MASSDEEGEITPDCVDNYHFVDDYDQPVSFVVLPLQWSGTDTTTGSETKIFLHGTADNGLQKLHKKVIAWKVDLSCWQPEISVLSKDINWIKLQRPRMSFAHTIRKVLVTVHWLHCLKRNPEASKASIWKHLEEVLSSYEVVPSENDLLDHMQLISEAAVWDRDLTKSKCLLTFLERPRLNFPVDKDLQASKKPSFIVDEDCVVEESNEKDNQHFDTVCAICDDGGDVLPCEGKCMRSFHPTRDAGVDSLCVSLGYTHTEYEPTFCEQAMQVFECMNCKLQQHQCFACGALGSSSESIGAEVICCFNASCGHFYHPQCIANLMHPEDAIQADILKQKIMAGESFTCPVHKCFICKEAEGVHDLQFAVCRRCPRAYHKKCLPREIKFEGDGVTVLQRAWNGLLPSRILIYCLDHKILVGLGTPERNHILFPNERKTKNDHELLSMKAKITPKRSRFPANLATDMVGVKLQNQAEIAHDGLGDVNCFKEVEKRSSEQGRDTLKKPKITDVNGKLLRDDVKEFSKKIQKPLKNSEMSLLVRNNKSLANLAGCPINRYLQKASGCEVKTSTSNKPMINKVNPSQTAVDAQMEKGILDLMEKCKSSFSIEDFMKTKKIPATHANCSRNILDKTVTLGRVEGSVKAVRAALEKLEKGCSIEDAKLVCEPYVLHEIMKWRRKLNVYLAPFLHGMRYTSFGRHFTKVDKLKRIVDRLDHYVQNGDMIVDFCCGANDFSCLMKAKLENSGKTCSFRNYDLIRPKNAFAFERRDWMSVGLEELPDGSQLIMGLNPPFGVKAALANRFIDKALEFRPKLLILIVPEETTWLDRKAAAYDLVWEDNELLAGKSFYLPGSVDVHDKQLEQWNWKAPPLYLWSRPDWTARHREIAQEHGHIFKEKVYSENNEGGIEHSNYLMKENRDCYHDFSNEINPFADFGDFLDDIPDMSDDPEAEGNRAIIYEPRREAELPQQGILNGWDYEENDMCIDMELSTPPASPLAARASEVHQEWKVPGYHSHSS